MTTDRITVRYKFIGWKSHLLGAVRSFLHGSKACVGIDREEGKYYSTKAGLRQECLISL